MSAKYPPEAVLVSQQAHQSDDPYDLVYSNIEVVSSFLEEHFHPQELSQQALQSYYVDYFYSELNNGGFSQFVYNTGWDESVDFVTAGFQAIGATRHLELFEDAARQIMEKLGTDRLIEFFESDYFGENDERDFLNAFDEAFYALEEHEDLIELNSRWLRSLPNLVVLTEEEIDAELQARISALPDHEQRASQALEEGPKFEKIIRAFCDQQNLQLNMITGGNPSHEYNAQQVLAWHFLTDQGPHYMIEVGTTALLFNSETHEKISELDASIFPE